MAGKTKRLQKEWKELEERFNPQHLLLWVPNVFLNTHQSPYFNIYRATVDFSISGWCHSQAAGFPISHLLMQLTPADTDPFTLVWEGILPSCFCCSLEIDAWKKGLNLLPIQSPWRQSFFPFAPHSSLQRWPSKPPWPCTPGRNRVPGIDPALYSKVSLSHCTYKNFRQEFYFLSRDKFRYKDLYIASSKPWLLIIRVWYRR